MVSTLASGLPLSIPDEIQSALNQNAAVAVGVSGGKDSQAAALAVAEHLERIGHDGLKLLIHSDLGRVEWTSSLPVSQRLADHIGWPLVVVRRRAGGLMERWLGRWSNNVARYVGLECMKVIPPWSTPKMRFCTSELKNDVIAGELRKLRNPAKFDRIGQTSMDVFGDCPVGTIISATGIRAEESSRRARMPAHARNEKLASKRLGAEGWNWNPIIRATKPQVLDAIAGAGLDLHEAYTKYGTSRVSCAYCIMSAGADLAAAATAEETHGIYREMCDLELESTFSFQAQRWLSTVRPELLGQGANERIAAAMDKAWRREQAESRLPEGMLFVKHWPIRMPTRDEAELIAGVRTEVAAIMGLEAGFTTAEGVLGRIDDLLVQKAEREQRRNPRAL